jgi:RNA polymerase sigma-70 factor (ECF subfamily)
LPGVPGVSDAQLIALARESKADAIEVLYGAYKGRIYTFLLRLLADPELADDITQDVFTKAYQALDTLTKEHKVLPWLYRIANNSAIDHLRRKKRIQWLRVGGLLGTREEPLMPDAHGAVPERDQVQAVLKGMPVEHVTALLLHALEGYSYKEIAEIQGCTMPAVRSRIARARNAFRVAYETKESS